MQHTHTLMWEENVLILDQEILLVIRSFIIVKWSVCEEDVISSVFNSSNIANIALKYAKQNGYNFYSKKNT